MNLPPKVRQAIYAINTISAPIVTYLGTQNKLSTFWVGLYAVIATATFALAGLNVSNK